MPSVEQILINSLTKVLETVAFSKPVRLNKDYDFQGEYSLVSISFRGVSIEGKVSQCFPKKMLKEMSELMGVSGILSDVEDKVNSEILNMVVGHFLTDYYGFDCDIDLGIPLVCEFSPSEINPEVICSRVNDEFVIGLWLEEGTFDETN